MAQINELSKNHSSKGRAAPYLLADVKPRSCENIGGGAQPSMQTVSETMDAKVVESRPGSSAKDILARLLAFTLEYKFDCKGCCWMPATFRVLAAETADSSVPVGSKLFQCDSSLPCALDTTFVDQLVITCLFPAGKSGGEPLPFLRLKPGVHSDSWCATNDKIDVYAIDSGEEQHIGFVVRRIGCCDYEWQVRSPGGAAKYAILSTKRCAASYCEMALEVRNLDPKSDAGPETIRKVTSWR